MAKKPGSEGHAGWDEYAPFYDWENARTLGRRDVPFWRTLGLASPGLVLELGCGTGRVAMPLGRVGVHLVGIDRSGPMLALAQRRVARARLGGQVSLVRGDIRALPFPASTFATVIAPYGVLQSLLRERDLAATLAAVHHVLGRGGTFGVELVADLPSWDEHRKRVSLKGWRRRRGGVHVTLMETVRQDRVRRLTIFDQEFTERRGRQHLVSGGQGARTRAQILLAADATSTDEMIALNVGVGTSTVYRTKQRFVEEGLRAPRSAPSRRAAQARRQR